MRKSRLVLVAILLLGGVMRAEDFYRCYEYKTDDFRVDSPLPWERVVLAVPKIFPTEEKYPALMLLLDRAGRRESMSQYLYCRRDPHGSGYICGGECDGGTVRLTDRWSLYFGKKEMLGLDMVASSSDGADERAPMRLKKGIQKTQGHPVSCPPLVEMEFNPERDGEHAQRAPALNVCYRARHTVLDRVWYTGCTIRARPCVQSGQKHFGHYSNGAETYEAFLRCLDGHRVKKSR